MKIAFIGGGHMTCAMVEGLTRHSSEHTITVVDRNADKRQALSSQFNINVTAYPSEIPADTNVLIVAVKPIDVRAVCENITLANSIIISVAAGVTLNALSQWLPIANKNIARVMPNTPISVGMGMSVCYTPSDSDNIKSTITALLEPCSKVMWADEESQLDAATAISGSGPGYVYYFAEAMEKAAMQIGFSAAQARLLVAQTLQGGGAMLSHKAQPANILRHAVAVPGGATERAIAIMQKENLNDTIARAIDACHKRAQAIGQELNKDKT